jgi:hypothetical protein
VEEAIATTVEVPSLGEPGPSGMLTRLARVGLLLDDFQHRCFDRFRLRFIDSSVLRVLHLAGPPDQTTPTRLSESRAGAGRRGDPDPPRRAHRGARAGDLTSGMRYRTVNRPPSTTKV